MDFLITFSIDDAVLILAPLTIPIAILLGTKVADWMDKV